MQSGTSQLPFYVIGHRNPDTDAICSAIGHAAFLRMIGDSRATAARCGEPTLRTAWVLEQAGIEPPILVDDVRATVGMVCRRDVIQAAPDETFLNAYQKMLFHGVRAVPVVDSSLQVHGILRYLDLLELLLPSESNGIAVRNVSVVIQKMAMTLDAANVGAPYPSKPSEENLIVLVGASSQSTVEARLRKASEEGTVGRFLVICGDRPFVHNLAIQYGVRALIVTGGYPIEPALEAAAKEKNICILLAKQDTASCATLIRCSRTVQHVLDESFITVSAEEPVSLLKKRISSLAQELFPVIDPDTRQMIGVMSKSDMIDPPRVQLSLVDHNEFAQAVRGVEEAEVVEVIDHHRLAGDLVSREPIRYLNEPVGSTSTLVARKFSHRNLIPDSGVALCLLAGIISDTLNLTSPTTTYLDKEMLSWLAHVAGVDAADFTKQFFQVGSLLANATPDQIINSDRKEFSDEGVKISIAQVEELGMSCLASRQAELIAHLHHVAEEEQLDMILLCITDVTEHNSMILCAGNETIYRNLPYEQVIPGVFYAAGVVSRKKQIFPASCEAIHLAKR